MGSPDIDDTSSRRVVVGVADMAVCSDFSGILTTYALGSCVGVLVYDPVLKAAGLLHLLLPDSASSASKAAAQPAMFADTGLPLFFAALEGVRMELARVRILVAGGASVLNGHDPFRIGERNARAVLSWLKARGLVIHRKHLGGTVNRSLHLGLEGGEVSMKTPLGEEMFSLVD